MERVYFEDFHVGDCVVTPGRTITETDIVSFAALTGDWHPVHTNQEYARNTAFGQRIAHGLLILAISNGLMFRTDRYVLLPEATLVLYAIEKVRFVVPTKIGDTVHLESEVARLTEVDDERGLITLRQRVKNQHGERVLTFLMKVVVRRRPH